MRLLFTLTLVALSWVALPGCKGKCRALSEKLCECNTNTLAKDACMRRASNEESRVNPTEEDEARCGELLAQCNCHAIDTLEGKRACGLAR